MSAGRWVGPTGPVGEPAARPDHPDKVTGVFRYASDLDAADVVWAATTRSPHPHAEIVSIDTSAARALPGVLDVITHEDVPGRKLYGQMMVDQPVLASDVVRFHGEPLAVVAAVDARTAAEAAAAVAVEYRVRPALTDPVAARAPDAPRVHPEGNVVARKCIRRGDAQREAAPEADVVVVGEYRVGRQDPAYLGPEAGLALPTADGGVELRVATQWLHVDRDQIAHSLDLPPEKVVVVAAGVGGAFGGREDLSVHVPACPLALRLGRAVRMSYGRAESFLGHVHRHPTVLRYEHGATADGRLVYVRADITLDGGAYAASSPAIAGNAATHAVGPYHVPHVWADAVAVYTNNPPAGAMRGFGTVQPCFAYESQMDRLAAATGLDPVELRLRNALEDGGELPTGQVLDGPVPVAELLTRLRALPLPPPSPAPTGDDPDDAGAAAGTRTRGVAYAAGFKNIAFSEGFDDYSTARVCLAVVDGRPVAEVSTAAVDVGQGLLAVQQQIVATELGVSTVVVASADSGFGMAGPTSASRQTYVTGGAVRAACHAVRDTVLEAVDASAARPLELAAEKVLDAYGAPVAELSAVLGDRVVEHVAEFHHPETVPLDPVHGQGHSAMQFGFVAHRAVVEVDRELGLVTVVELATAQDVGRAVNPAAIAGQLHGGSVQGLGLALTEELVTDEGYVVAPGFDTYQLPTARDVPRIPVEVLECPDPKSPYGLRGIGELPAISSTAAVALAVGDAVGRPVTRVPVRPADIARPAPGGPAGREAAGAG